MDQTYTFAQIQAALTAPRGVAVAIQCSNNTNLDEVWYYYDVRGSIVTGQFVDVAPGMLTPPSSRVFANTLFY